MYIFIIEIVVLCSALQINFREADYFITEGSDTLSSAITLEFRNNQNPFTVRLTAVTVDTAESMKLGFFINSAMIAADSRATLGQLICPLFASIMNVVHDYDVFSLSQILHILISLMLSLMLQFQPTVQHFKYLHFSQSMMIILMKMSRVLQ